MISKKLVQAITTIGLALTAINSYAVDCSNLALWDSTNAYSAGAQIHDQGVAYSAKWWTKGDVPTSNIGNGLPWNETGSCDAGTGGGSSSSSSSSSGSSTSGGQQAACAAAGVDFNSVNVYPNWPQTDWEGTPDHANGGDLLSYQGSVYRARWWIQTTPGGDSGWDFVCDGGGAGSSSSSTSSTGSTSSNSSSSTSSTSSSTSSSSSSSSSGGVGNNPLPRHALIGYWHNFDNGSGLIRIKDVSDDWDVIVLAFANDAGNGNVAFNLDPGLDKAEFIADIKAKRQAGKKVVLSFGGQNGRVTLNSAANVTNFVNSTSAIMDEYGLDGIDIDLESGASVVHGAPVIANLVSAGKQLDAMYPDFYLSMAPEHPYVQGGVVVYSGIWGAYLPIIDGLRDELDVLHVQLYNNGGMSSPYSTTPYAAGTVDMLVASARMLIEGFETNGGGFFEPLRADQVAFGLPSGPSSAGSGQASNDVIKKAFNCITRLVDCGSHSPVQKHPNFRGVMTWSINWDRHDSFIFSKPLGSFLHNN